MIPMQKHFVSAVFDWIFDAFLAYIFKLLQNIAWVDWFSWARMSLCCSVGDLDVWVDWFSWARMSLCHSVGNLDGAAAEKHRLEEKQRAARKERKRTKEEWSPRLVPEAVQCCVKTTKLQEYSHTHRLLLIKAISKAFQYWSWLRHSLNGLLHLLNFTLHSEWWALFCNFWSHGKWYKSRK